MANIKLIDKLLTESLSGFYENLNVEILAYKIHDGLLHVIFRRNAESKNVVYNNVYILGITRINMKYVAKDELYISPLLVNHKLPHTHYIKHKTYKDGKTIMVDYMIHGNYVGIHESYISFYETSIYEKDNFYYNLLKLKDL